MNKLSHPEGFGCLCSLAGTAHYGRDESYDESRKQVLTSATHTDTISLTAIEFSRAGKPVLDLPALCLSEKRIGIVGRNGSGKTTLLRILAGLVTPDKGCVTINGADVASDRKAAIRAVGILFQNPDHQIIFPTVEEEISFGLQQLGQAGDTLVDNCVGVLKRFGKERWLNRPVQNLSQGQRHLVCLMSVLAMTPATILLDEPFAGLDIPTTRALNRAIDGVEEQVLMITHDPERLQHFDRIIWIDGGKIEQDGAPSEVLPKYLKTMNEEGADAFPDL